MAAPLPQRRAVIDVGTNSVKLLVGDVEARRIAPVLEQANQTRLGVGFYASHRLQSPAIRRTAEAVAAYSKQAVELGATSVRVIATSVARDAANAQELLDAIFQSSGLRAQILSGQQEADWAFRGVAANANLSHGPALVLDVGGGSTEFILGQEGRARYSASFPIGAVRLLEQLNLPNPPSMDALAQCRDGLRDFLNRQVAPALDPALRQSGQPPRLIGASGTAAILARMAAKANNFDREQIEATVIPLPKLSVMLEALWPLPLAARRSIPGLPPDRVDVMAAGMAIYEAIMARFGFASLEISTRGLRFWALVEGAQ